MKLKNLQFLLNYVSEIPISNYLGSAALKYAISTWINSSKILEENSSPCGHQIILDPYKNVFDIIV